MLANKVPQKISSPQEILKRHWGYNQFRGPQLNVIDSFMQGRDNLLVMATGAGKSICMQVPALLTGRTAIIISPLVRDARMERRLGVFSNRLRQSITLRFFSDLSHGGPSAGA